MYNGLDRGLREGSFLTHNHGLIDDVSTSSFDPDAKAYFLAAGITDPIQKKAWSNAVKSFKNAGLWVKIEAVYPFLGGTESTHKYNAKDPRDLDAAYRLVFTGGWTHSSTGVKPNGSTGLADTKINAFTARTRNDHGESCYLRDTTNVANGYNGPISCMDGSTQARWETGRPSFDNTQFYFADIYDGTGNFSGLLILNTAGFNFTGLLSTSRSSSSVFKAYSRGVLKGTNSNTNANALPNSNYSLGGNSLGGKSSVEQAFTAFHKSLSDAEVAIMSTIVQQFQIDLGRQVY